MSDKLKMKPIDFPKRFKTFAPIFVLAMIVDQFSKYLAVQYLAGGADYSLFGGFISLSYIENPYGFLGILTKVAYSTRIFILIFVVGFILSISSYYLFTKRYIEKTQLILGSIILAGGCSNLFDRFIHSGVIDFIAFDLFFFKTGIGNFADFMIMISGAVLGFLICKKL